MRERATTSLSLTHAARSKDVTDTIPAL